MLVLFLLLPCELQFFFFSFSCLLYDKLMFDITTNDHLIIDDDMWFIAGLGVTTVCF